MFQLSRPINIPPQWGEDYNLQNFLASWRFQLLKTACRVRSQLLSTLLRFSLPLAP